MSRSGQGSGAALFVGIMSGTSLDGADAILVDFSGATPRTLGFASLPFTPELRSLLQEICGGTDDTLDRVGAAAVELGKVYAHVVASILEKAATPSDAVTAIGCHGQTVRHRPESGFTLQLNSPAQLAEATGIDVIADFRSRDVAAGGQGAPLAPAFHRAVFQDPRRSRAVVNIGGISNITWLPPNGRMLGFDCGPGNVLLDTWASRHLGKPYDEDGRWAASGQADDALLARFLEEPFLAAEPPKSTGRELFRRDWLERRLTPSLAPQVVQSTLAQFTARSIADAIERHCPGTEEIFLAGGGARNPDLVERIRSLAGGRPVEPTDALGVPSGHVEALAFAWLAMKHVRREAIDLTTITGARGSRILGAFYPA